ncbi:uncharacterized protein G2W53_027242 [Senna tora]|uniref:Uncharacterized protein n=1 Tax=Senna tora TaxID=362788 RepID=A0A834TGJ5_9FABA|nr:uncharacterized protein G2W53_027242 [Senna tora]
MSSSSSSTASASASSSSSTVPKTNSLFSSSSQAAPVKLDRTNYLVWEFVVFPLIKGNRLAPHIDGTSVAPPPLIPAPEGKSKNNSNGPRGGRNNNHGGRSRGGRRANKSTKEDKVLGEATVISAAAHSPSKAATPNTSRGPTRDSSFLVRDSSLVRESSFVNSKSGSDAHGSMQRLSHEGYSYATDTSTQGESNASPQSSSEEGSSSDGPNVQVNDKAQSSTQHVMTTRSKAGIYKPKAPYVGMAEKSSKNFETPASISTEPKTHFHTNTLLVSGLVLSQIVTVVAVTATCPLTLSTIAFQPTLICRGRKNESRKGFGKGFGIVASLLNASCGSLILGSSGRKLRSVRTHKMQQIKEGLWEILVVVRRWEDAVEPQDEGIPSTNIDTELSNVSAAGHGAVSNHDTQVRGGEEYSSSEHLQEHVRRRYKTKGCSSFRIYEDYTGL